MKTKFINSGCFEIAITTDRSGRTSIIVRNEILGKQIIDVELPAQTGEWKNSFVSCWWLKTICIKVDKEITIQQLK